MADFSANVFPVLLAGGSGTRLWPVSRELYPKQLVKFFGDDSLVQATVRRLVPVLDADRVRVVCGQQHYHEIARHLEDIDISSDGKIYRRTHRAQYGAGHPAGGVSDHETRSGRGYLHFSGRPRYRRYRLLSRNTWLPRCVWPPRTTSLPSVLPPITPRPDTVTSRGPVRSTEGALKLKRFRGKTGQSNRPDLHRRREFFLEQRHVCVQGSGHSGRVSSISTAYARNQMATVFSPGEAISRRRL